MDQRIRWRKFANNVIMYVDHNNIPTKAATGYSRPYMRGFLGFEPPQKYFIVNKFN